MAEVSRCESRFKQYESDGTPLKGKITPADTGVMQINKDYHLGTAISMGIDLDHIDGNLEFARYLHDRNGYSDWSASRGCWSGFASR